LLLLILSFLFPLKGMASAVPLILQSDTTPETVGAELPGSTWRWLAMKRQLTVALYGSGLPPVTQYEYDDVLRGIIPELVQSLGQSLSLQVKFVHYGSREEALEALQESHSSIDAVVAAPGKQPSLGPSVLITDDLLSPVPVMVRSDRAAKHHRPGANVIAVQEGLLSKEDLSTLYPDKEFTFYPDVKSALASVVLGKSDKALGDLIPVNFMIERHFANLLTLDSQVSTAIPGYRLYVRNDGTPLYHALNTVIQNISIAERELLLRRWDQGSVTAFLAKPLSLTREETDWIKNNPEVNILVSQFTAPFMLFDDRNNFYGITADVLNLIHLKTGLKFIPQREDYVNNAQKKLNDPALPMDMVGGVIWSPERAKQFLLTRPFMYSPNVLVMNEQDPSLPYHPGMRIGVPAGHAAVKWIREQYPAVKVTEIGNASLAMQELAEGKLDGVVTTMISADYIIARYYPAKLRIAGILPIGDAAVSLAVRRGAPELFSIINKALAAVPPKMYTDIISRWQGTPEAQFRTWTVYRGQFYLLAASAALLLITALLWGYANRRRVKANKLAEAKYQAELNFQDRLINGPPRPVYVFNNDGMIIRSNRAFRDFFSEEQHPLLTLPLQDRRNPLDDVFYSITSKWSDSGYETESVYESEFVLFNGFENRKIRHWITPYSDDQNRQAGWICGWQDITEYLQLLDEISHAKEAAELANRSKSQFLATMSHEIRTPLSAVIGLLELNVRDAAKPDPDSLRVAYDSAESLMGLIGDILDMSKIESGKLELQPEWLELRYITRQVTRVFDGLARQKGLMLNLHKNIPEVEIFTDPTKLRQIIANLVSNAIKFTEQGQVDVNVDLIVNEQTQKAHITISVRDTGVGIDKSTQDKVFRPFEQGGANDAAGTGLGLAITAELVKMMSGTLTLDSIPSIGTCIKVELNADYRASALSLQHSENRQKKARAVSILIADDHPANRLLLSRQLTILGHNVAEAENGKIALEKWKSAHFDLIITDCNMPVMDGLSLSKSIRAATSDPIVILGLTANAQLSEKERCIGAGMNDCLFRPLELNRLSDTLNFYFHETENKSNLTDWIDFDVMRDFLPEDNTVFTDFLGKVFEEGEKDLA
ncbi:response regulator, partial [Pantoea endophytica]